MTSIKVFEGERVWQVRIALPKDPAKGRGWALNRSLSVIAPTLERAVACVRECHPDCTVWGASHRGSDGELIVDAALLADVR